MKHQLNSYPTWVLVVSLFVQGYAHGPCRDLLCWEKAFEVPEDASPEMSKAFENIYQVRSVLVLQVNGKAMNVVVIFL